MPKSPPSRPSPPKRWAPLDPVEQRIQQIAWNTLAEQVLGDPWIVALFQRWDTRAGVWARAQRVHAALVPRAAEVSRPVWQCFQQIDPARDLPSTPATTGPRWTAARKAAVAWRHHESRVRDRLATECLSVLDRQLRLPAPGLADALVREYLHQVEPRVGLGAPIDSRLVSVSAQPPSPVIHIEVPGDAPRRQQIARAKAQIDAARCRARDAARSRRRRPKRGGAHIIDRVTWLYRVRSLREDVDTLAHERHDTLGHPRPLADCYHDDRNVIKTGLQQAARWLGLDCPLP